MIKNTLMAIAFAAGVSGLIVSLANRENKSAFIEMGKVYEEFYLSKELNSDLEKVVKARKAVVDSLFEDLRQKTMDLKYREKKTAEDIQKLARLEEEYLYRKDLIEKDNLATSSQFNTKIWNQLNQYLHDYGSEKKLTIIFGANGQGNIMYGDTSKNITTEVIAYVNSHYNNKGAR